MVDVLDYVRETLRLLPPLLLALALGGAIGVEREWREKPAGLRTHMMVALGSATFVTLAYRAALELPHAVAIDPTRVLQGVVGGIGFLGAGTIIQGRGGVRGITTAAGLWLCGGIGAACGTGSYELAVTATFLALVVMTVMGKLRRVISTGGSKSQGAASTGALGSTSTTSTSGEA